MPGNGGSFQSVSRWRIVRESSCREYSDTTRSCSSIAHYVTLSNGLWLSCLVSPKTFDRDHAMDAVYSYLRSVFPDHYE